jgi:hypothetical protein
VLYDQVYRDFNVKKRHVSIRVIILGALNLENDEIKCRLKQELINLGSLYMLILEQNQQKQAEFSRPNLEYNFLGVPVPSIDYKSVPMIILVQNPFMSSGFSSTNLKNLEFTVKGDKANSVFSYKINNFDIGEVINFEFTTLK